MASLQPIIIALWRHLGLPAPAEPIETHYSFELEDIPVAMELQPNGDSITMKATLGLLERSPHMAGDQLRQLLRLGLGLSARNAAVLDVSNARQLVDNVDLEAPVEVHAITHVRLGQPDGWVPALEDLVEWKGYAVPVLGAYAPPNGNPFESVAPRSSGSQSNDFGDDMMIFQP